MSNKPTLRRHFKTKRHLGKAATRSIQDAVAVLIDQSNCGNRHVGIYWPLPGEADLRPLREGPHPPLALPVADGNGRLIYRSWGCLLYTSPSPRDLSTSRMPSSA